jgi:hypothetical protein
MSPILEALSGRTAFSWAGGAALEANVVIASSGTGVQAYSWSAASGVGSAIGSNTGSINGGAGPGQESVRWGNDAVAITQGADLTGEGLYGFAFNKSTGIGTKYSAPTRPTSRTREPYWTPNGAWVVVGTDGGSQAFAYPFTIASGWGSRQTGSSGGNRSSALAPSGLAYSSANTTGNAQAFSLSAGFGSVYSGTQNPGGYWSAIRFSPNSDVLAVAMEGNVAVNIAYAFNTTTGWGSKYANPSTSGYSFTVSDGTEWAPDQKAIATTGRNGSPYLAVWAWTNASGYGTKYADPSTTANASGGSVFFSPGGTVIGLSSGGSPAPMTWAFSTTTGFGTKYSYSTGTGFLAFNRLS